MCVWCIFFKTSSLASYSYKTASCGWLLQSRVLAHMSEPAPFSPPTPPECFICTDSTPVPRKSACLCTDRYVHDACLAQMLATKTRATCPVCTAPYTNVRSRSHIVGVECESAGGCGVFMLVSAIFQLFCAIATWRLVASHTHLPPTQLATVWGAATLMTVVTVGLILGMIRFVVLRGLARLVQSVIVRELKVHVLPARALPEEVAIEFESS